MNNERKIVRGEVYYIKSFPTVGHEQRSGRPAVIVSNNENNTHSGTFEICYLTLQDKPKLPTHVFIDRGPCINSTVLCEQITTVAQDKVGDYMCIVPDDIMDNIDNALAISLGIDYPFNISRREPDEVDNLKNKISKLEAELYASKDSESLYERMYNDLLDRLVKRG